MDSKDGIAGLLVVRLPHLSIDDELGHDGDEVVHPGDIYYSGIDRMPWWDVDENFYKGTLPFDVRLLRQSLKESNKDFTGLDLCRDLNAALILLE